MLQGRDETRLIAFYSWSRRVEVNRLAGGNRRRIFQHPFATQRMLNLRGLKQPLISGPSSQPARL